MTLHFITGNAGKLEEAKAILGDVDNVDLDLPEIQETDPKEVIGEKLKEAIKVREGEFFCEDTSLYFDCLNGFPGPLIKWMLKSIGHEGISELVGKYENRNAVAKTVIGYTDGKETKFFEGELNGKIVSPKGERGFGFDKIFQPEGHEKTLGEMSADEKNEISMRKRALNKMKEYLAGKP